MTSLIARPFTLLICAVATAILIGCGHHIEPVKEIYIGPTDSMAEVVQDVNANNAKVNTLRASHSYDALIYDASGKERQFSGDGYLLFRKPGDLLLTGKVLGQDAFTAASNADRYWFTVPREDTMWWGEKANFTPEKARQMPIRPDLLLEVLGVLDVETNFMQPPVPVMRFHPNERAYMFVWSYPLAGQWVPLKEVWYDLETKLPRLVNLFDERGRVVLRAYLSEHREVEGAGGGKIATRFELLFPDTRSQMNFRLKTVQVKFKNLPNDASFAFPEEPGVGKIIEIK